MKANDNGAGARGSLALLVLLLWLLAPVEALAGPPSHSALPALNLVGAAPDPGPTHPAQPFDHACGAAVDSSGDAYVASAANEVVDVFNADHEYLASIADASEPCGLAVDSEGNLYVSNQASGEGKIVKYTPNAYPFSGTLTYGPPVMIDPSGEAKGIAVDPTDDNLYVAEGDRISVYDSSGALATKSEVQAVFPQGTGGSFRLAMPGEGGPSRNEIQRLNWGTNELNGGSFTVSFEGQTSTPIAESASAGEVKAALVALSTIGVGNVNVTGFHGNRGYWIEFTGALAKKNVPLLVVDQANFKSLGQIEVGAFSDISASIAYGASSNEVQLALEGLESIGTGNAQVEKKSDAEYMIMFASELADTNVESLAGDGSGLENSEFGVSASTVEEGFDGYIGQGDLATATGVAAYTSLDEGHQTHYISAADGTDDVVKVFSGESLVDLALRQTIDGSDQDAFKADKTPDNGFGFGVEGTALTADWTNGHLFLYDDDHQTVDEFEATGEYVTQIADPDFADAQPSGIATFPQRDEVQRLKTSCTGGSFTLSFQSETTGSISCSATDSQIEVALEALPTIGTGNVAVSGRYNVPSGAYSIAFVEDRGSLDVAQLAVDGSSLTGGSKSASIVTEAQGSGPGRVYVTAGAGPGAKLLAFAPLAAASRRPRPDLSFALTHANSVAVDAYGNRYVGAESSVGVYPPDSNTPLTTIADPGKPQDLVIDSACNVYAYNRNTGGAKESVAYYSPNSCPPGPGASYSGPTTVATGGPPYFATEHTLSGIGLDSSNDHIYVNQFSSAQTIELGSAAEGSPILDPNWGSDLSLGQREDIRTCAASGKVYVSGSGEVVYVIDSSGSKILTRITGVGGPKGPFNPHAAIAVNQSNCHVLVFEFTRGVAEEYEASGAFVAEFGSFSTIATGQYGVAIDSSCDLQKPPLEKAACGAFDPSYGNVYVAFDDPSLEKEFDLNAFDPLSYGEPPLARTGLATGVGGGNATLNGTVDPHGSDLEDCRFEYLTAPQYLANGETFAAATSVPCAESIAAIGHGTGTVSVHADISSLDPEARYRFRLVAENKYGPSDGDAGLFGPPLVTTKSAQPISYDEATLRATVDPSGLSTKYRFEYGTSEAYGQVTPTVELPPDAGPTEISVPIFGLAEGTEYHFRIVAENEANTAEGFDESLVTLERPAAQDCPNGEFRTGRSVGLPDCRAYELVTPADTRGLTPAAGGTAFHQFNNWLVAPSGDGAGERLDYFVDGTLPGFDGNGIVDGYLAQRAEGAHPAEGWRSGVFSPSFLESPASFASAPSQEGIAPDQRYSFWEVVAPEGTLGPGTYLRTPSGFELLGKGSLGTDPHAFSDYVSSGGAHVIFGSKAHLEADTPLAATNTEAIYDRAAGGAGANVVSMKPGNEPFGAGESATYIGATEDGSAVVFKVNGTLYLRRAGETLEVAAATSTFAGISEGGTRVFYVAADASGRTPAPASLYVCDLSTGPCAGSGAHAPVEIAPDSRFVNVAAHGSHAYFTSTEALDEAGKAIEGKDNLYVWNIADETTRFIAILDPQDLVAEGFQGAGGDNLSRWPDAIGFSQVGRASSPTRSTPDGSVLVFESYAKLSAYDTQGHYEVYRYDSEASADKQIICLSCDPSGTPPSGNGLLQFLGQTGTAGEKTLIPNVTDDGGKVFFQSKDQLLPEDVNGAEDVYEWQAQGTSGCERKGGCLWLISSGQGEQDSYLYSMTPDGHDVFFTTKEKLVARDISGSPSIYDAREFGGIPIEEEEAICQGDACQPQGSPPPALPNAATTGAGEGNAIGKAKPRCAKGKLRVKGRCIAKHPRRKRHHRASHNRGARR